MPVQSPEHRVLILLGADWSGINRLPPLLLLAGFAVDVFCARNCRLSASQHVTVHVSQAATFSDFVADVGAFLARNETTYCWTLVADDPLLLALSAHRQQEWVQRLLPASGAGLDFLLSKLAFPILAARAGIRVPKSFVHRDPDTLKAAAEQLGYPLILKRPQGFSGQSVFRIESRARLDAMLQALQADAGLLLQEQITGVEIGATAIWQHGRLLAWLAFEKVRTWPGRFGPASMVRLCAPPQMQGMLEIMGQVSGFHGLGGADFMRDEIGNLFALEQHGRPNGQFVLADQVGIDLPALLRTLILASEHTNQQFRPEQPVQSPQIHDTRWFPLFPQEAERQLAQGQWRTLRRWLLHPRYRAMLPLDDPALLDAELRRLQQRAQAPHVHIPPTQIP